MMWLFTNPCLPAYGRDTIDVMQSNMERLFTTFDI